MLKLLWETGWQDRVEACRSFGWTADPFYLRYLLEHDAPLDEFSGYELCKHNDVDLIRLGMERGIDVIESGGWAKALLQTGAKPLIRFYLAERDRLPGLRQQASTALAEAIEEGKIRAVMLLTWAGVDPFGRIPGFFEKALPPKKWTHFPAANLAYGKERSKVLEILKLKPSPQEWVDLISALRPHGEFLETILALRPDSERLLKEYPDEASELLVSMINNLLGPYLDILSPSEAWRTREIIATCHRLIDLGATISFPKPRSIVSFRQRLSSCSAPKPLIEIIEYAWKAGSQRTRDGIRQLARRSEMQDFLRKNSPRLAGKLGLDAID